MKVHVVLMGHRDLLPATKFAPLNLFLQSMCYPLKNHFQIQWVTHW